MAEVLEELTINEISCVDRGANREGKIAHATIALLKREDSMEEVTKLDQELRDLCKADDTWDDADELCKAVEGKTEPDGKRYPKSDFAFTPDDTPSHWKLRLTSTPGGAPDPRIVGAAVAALGKGFRGKKVQIPSDALPAVRAKVRAAWRKANPDKGAEDIPSVLKGATMTLEQIEKQLGDQTAVIDALKAENELVVKMGKKERKAYGMMDADERKTYMAADEGKRGKLVEEKLKASKSKKDGEEPDEDDMEEKEAKKRAEELNAAVAKAQSDAAAAQDLVKKAEQRLAEIEKQGRVQHFQKVAESELPNTPGSPVEKGEMLMNLAETLPGGESGDVFKKYMANLKAADKAMEPAFREFGKSSAASIEITKMMDVKAEEIAKRDKITPEAAFAKALLENPDLYEQYCRENPAPQPR